MPRTLQQMIDERAGSLVGRDRELSMLLGFVDGDGPLVAVVHGIAGVGKSTLLRAFAPRARARGARVVQLDGGAIEPTERGFLGALGESLGSVEDAAGRLGALEGPTVLVVDALERLGCWTTGCARRSSRRCPRRRGWRWPDGPAAAT